MICWVCVFESGSNMQGVSSEPFATSICARAATNRNHQQLNHDQHPIASYYFHVVSTRFVCLEFHAVVYAFSIGSFLVAKYCITSVFKLYMFSALRFHLSLLCGFPELETCGVSSDQVHDVPELYDD